MKKIFAAVGAFAFNLALQINAAEAITRTYEAGGRRYTYDTRDSLQVQAARKLIEAANTADAAKAKADAERAANALVSIIGSPTQTAATQAQDRLQLAITVHQKSATAQPRQPAKPVDQEASAKQSRRPLAAAKRQATPSSDLQAGNKQAAPAGVALSQKVSVSSELKTASPAVKAVFVDTASGIRTTFMTDGSIHEELIERAGPSAEHEPN